MAESVITSKGQTTIPKPIRDHLHMEVGQKLTFTPLPDGAVVLRVKNQPAAAIGGILRRKGQKPLPVDQLSR